MTPKILCKLYLKYLTWEKKRHIKVLNWFSITWLLLGITNWHEFLSKSILIMLSNPMQHSSRTSFNIAHTYTWILLYIIRVCIKESYYIQKICKICQNIYVYVYCKKNDKMHNIVDYHIHFDKHQYYVH